LLLILESQLNSFVCCIYIMTVYLGTICWWDSEWTYWTLGPA